MIKIIVKDASHCQVLKNPGHWEIIWEILSFWDKTRNPVYQTIQDVKKSTFDQRGGRFGTGLLSYVTSKLDNMEIDYDLIYNKEPDRLEIQNQILFKDITLESYQEKILKKVQNLKPGKTRGVLSSPTGSGKSIIAAGIIELFKRPNTLIIVPSEQIAKGMMSELKKILREEIGLLGDSQRKLEKRTVGLYQTIRKLNLKEVNKLFQMIIVDEAHEGISAVNEILSNLPNIWYRFGLTATPVPKHDKKKWFPVAGQIGETLVKIADKETKERVTDVEAYMFINNGKVKSFKYHEVEDEVLFSENRNKLLLEMVEFALNEKANCLLLVDEYQQALKIQKLAKKIYGKGFMIPEIAWSGVKTKLSDMKKRINEHKLRFCIATTVWRIGVNIPGVESLVLGSAKKSLINLNQKIGRSRRKIEGKGLALILDVYDDLDNERYFKKFSEKRKRYYKRKKWLKGILRKEKGVWTEEIL